MKNIDPDAENEESAAEAQELLNSIRESMEQNTGTHTHTHTHNKDTYTHTTLKSSNVFLKNMQITRKF